VTSPPLRLRCCADLRGHQGKTYELTGRELIGFAEVAHDLSRVTGTAIEYVDVTENDVYARLLADGFSSAFADYVVRHTLLPSSPER
jgi:uncharacterized protein YbjT (DUF2867 family)